MQSIYLVPRLHPQTPNTNSFLYPRKGLPSYLTVTPFLTTILTVHDAIYLSVICKLWYNSITLGFFIPHSLFQLKLAHLNEIPDLQIFAPQIPPSYCLLKNKIKGPLHVSKVLTFWFDSENWKIQCLTYKGVTNWGFLIHWLCRIIFYSEETLDILFLIDPLFHTWLMHISRQGYLWPSLSTRVPLQNDHARTRLYNTLPVLNLRGLSFAKFIIWITLETQI